MARRVNTKFVIILGACVAAAGMGVAGKLGWNYLENQNPDALKAKGEAQEKAGDLKAAVSSFGRAGEAASRKHLVGADDLFVHMAELSMKISKSAKTRDD